MAQPPILKAKISDRPALRDLANFVVPQASSRWYYLGLQLFDPREEGVLHSMRKEANKSLEDQCTEIFHHWLATKKNATWNKLIKSLKSQSVNLPNVARTIENMLDNRSVWARGKHKLKKRLFSQSSQIPATITECSSSYESSDTDKNEVIENESDEEPLQHTLPRTVSLQCLYCKQEQVMKPVAVANSHRFKSQSMSDLSLSTFLPSTESDIIQLCEEKGKSNKGECKVFSEDKHNNCVNDTNQENEQQNKIMIEKEREQGYTQQTEHVNKELTKQLKELTEQLQYKDKYVNERNKRIEVEDQLGELSNREKLDTLKQLLEKEYEGEELKKGVTQLKSHLTIPCKKQVTQQNTQATQDVKQVTQNLDYIEKTIYYKELNARDEIYEKRMNEIMETFNRQLKVSEEAWHRELQLKVEEVKREETKKFEYFAEAHTKQLNDLQLKVEEFKRDEARKLKDNEKVHRNELYNLQVKVEELKKKLEDSEEMQSNNSTLMMKMVKREEVKKLEELFKELKLLTETLKKEIEKLKKDNKELMKQLSQTNKLLMSKEDIISKFNDQKVWNKEFQAKVEEFEKEIKKHKEIVFRKVHDLKVEVDQQNYCIRQQLPHKSIEEYKKDDMKFKTELKSHEKKSEEQSKQHNKKHNQDKKGSKIGEEKVGELCNKNVSVMFPDGSSSTNCKRLNPDVLALMKKTEFETCKHHALSYNAENATIMIYCNDPKEREKIIDKLLTAYKELTMSDELKMHVFAVDDVQQANAIVDVCAKMFGHTYFKYDPEKKEIKCLSTDEKEMQNVKTKLILIKQNLETSEDRNIKLVSSSRYRYPYSSAGNIPLGPPPGFDLKQPDPSQPTSYPSYSHAVMQKQGRKKCPPNSAQFQPPPIPAQPGTQYNSAVNRQMYKRQGGSQL